MVVPAFGQEPISVGDDKRIIADANVWHELDYSFDTSNLESKNKLAILKEAYEYAAVVPSLGGKSGSYFTKVVLDISQKGQYFVVVNANFIDVGLASYSSPVQPELSTQVFSQLLDDSSPPVLHFQAVTVQTVMANERVELWLFIKAKQFPTPVSITVLDSTEFYRFQKFN